MPMRPSMRLRSPAAVAFQTHWSNGVGSRRLSPRLAVRNVTSPFRLKWPGFRAITPAFVNLRARDDLFRLQLPRGFELGCDESNFVDSRIVRFGNHSRHILPRDTIVSFNEQDFLRPCFIDIYEPRSEVLPC